MSKLDTFEAMRVWAAVTGLALAALYFGALWLHRPTMPALPLLVTAIGGFEMALYGQDLLIRRRRRLG